MQQHTRSNGPRRRYADGASQDTSSPSGQTLRVVTCGSSQMSSKHQENTLRGKIDIAIDAAIFVFGMLLVALLHWIAGEIRPSWLAFALIATSWCISIGLVRYLK